MIPLAFNSIAKDDYLSAMLAIYENHQTDPLQDLYTFSYQRSCKEYTSLLQSFDIDEVRVRFRKQRHTILGDIIRQGYTGQAMLAFIDQRISTSIPSDYHAKFRQNLLDDIQHLGHDRLAGLQVSQQEFQTWLALQH